ncbi:MAG: protoporphyrinogen oxidase [Deltaproteobacteria bacterium]|nr:protoporphyrinogen oxidase [Deltaproteobacteria bacterium]
MTEPQSNRRSEEVVVPPKPRRIAVVGGGLSGLAAAHRLLELSEKEGLAVEVHLFESSHRLGGSIWTHAIDAYPVVDGGADMFITDKPWGLALAERLGLGDKLISPQEANRRSLVLRDGKPVDVPEGFTLMAPTQLLPMVTTPLLSWSGKARMAVDALLPRRELEPTEDESIASFVRRRFGKELLDRVVQPLVGGIYTGNPESLSMRATMPRFLELEREHRSVAVGAMRRGRAAGKGTSGARYGLFVGPKGGMGVLVERLAERVKKKAKVTLSARVTELCQHGAAYRMRLAAAGPLEFDAVVLAIPAYASATLVEPFAPDVAVRLGSIPYASTAVVVSGHAMADVKHPLNAFGLVIPHIEKRKVLAISFASRKLEGRAPRGSVLLRTFVGGAMQPEHFDLSDARIEGLVLDELHELLGVDGTPDFIRVARHPKAMPQYLVGHVEKVAAIERGMTRFPGLALAGNALHGVGIPDCIRSGESAAEAVLRAHSGIERAHAPTSP